MSSGIKIKTSMGVSVISNSAPVLYSGSQGGEENCTPQNSSGGRGRGSWGVPPTDRSLKAVDGGWQERASFLFGSVATGRLPVYQRMAPHPRTFRQL